jgi:hypothetical protein
LNTFAALYIDAIQHETWATYAFPWPRFGHLTNNISESVNKAWYDIRFLQPLRMIDTIWSTVMKTIYSRYHAKQKNSVLCDIPLSKFQERQKQSRRYKVFESKEGVYQVQKPDSGLKFVVNLKENTCTCNNFWQYHGPCTHALTACYYDVEDPYKHFDKAYKVGAFRKCYSVPMPPLSTENLIPNIEIKPPIIVRKRGRPKTKRIRKGAWKKKSTQCSTCQGLGHNKRRCTNQPQRRHIRELSSASESTVLSSGSELSLLRSSMFDSSELDEAELEAVEDSAQDLLNHQLEENIRDLIRLFELETIDTTAIMNTTTTTTTGGERGRKRGRGNSQDMVAKQEKVLGKAPKVWPVTERILQGKK